MQSNNTEKLLAWVTQNSPRCCLTGTCQCEMFRRKGPNRRLCRRCQIVVKSEHHKRHLPAFVFFCACQSMCPSVASKCLYHKVSLINKATTNFGGVRQIKLSTLQTNSTCSKSTFIYSQVYIWGNILHHHPGALSTLSISGWIWARLSILKPNGEEALPMAPLQLGGALSLI